MNEGTSRSADPPSRGDRPLHRARANGRFRLAAGNKFSTYAHEPGFEELAAEAELPVERVRDLLALGEETGVTVLPGG